MVSSKMVNKVNQIIFTKGKKKPSNSSKTFASVGLTAVVAANMLALKLAHDPEAADSKEKAVFGRPL